MVEKKARSKFGQIKSKEYLIEAKNEYFKNVFENMQSIIKVSIITIICIRLVESSNILSKIENLNIPGSIHILSLILIFFILFELKVYSFFILRIYNYVDSILIYSILTIIAYLLFGFIDHYTIPTYIIGLLIIFVLVCVYRLFIIIKSAYNSKFSVKKYELYDLYMNSEEMTNTKYVLIADNPSNIDLLHRDFIISNLYDSIVSSIIDERVVISLEGEWGSGKTTIIEIVKKLLKEKNGEEIIIIDGFDPWMFNDKSSMLLNMFDRILSKTNLSPSYTSVNMFLNVFKETALETKFGKSSRILGSYKSGKYTDIERIREDIEDFLRVNGKKVVFFIDNIDRAEKENIKMLFKLIHSILGFDNLLYVLAFDEKIVCKVLDEDYSNGEEFLKKLIQLQIKMPAIEPHTIREIINRTTTNLLASYGYSKEVTNLISSIEFYPNLLSNIRDLKRFLNSVISSYFRTRCYLNAIDTLGVQLIKNENFELFNQIYNNPKYFVSNDIGIMFDLPWIVDKRSFNHEAKIYFDNLFLNDKNKRYVNLLSIMFPNVKKYGNKEDILVESPVLIIEPKKEKNERNKGKRIFSGKFFSLYFTDSRNEFIYVHDEIESLINTSSEYSSDTIADNFRELLFTKNNEYLTMLVLETLSYYIDDISTTIIEQFISVLIDDFYRFSTSSISLSLSAKERASVVISEYLLKLDDITFLRYTSRFSSELGNIGMIGSIYYWLHSHFKSVNDISNSRLIKFEDLFKGLGNQIIDNQINVFEDKYYHPGNLSGLYRSLDLSGYKSRISEYTRKVLSKDNVFKFLSELLVITNSSEGTSYSIRQETIELFVNIEFLDEIMNISVTNNTREEFIKKVYMSFKNGDKNRWGETEGILSDDAITEI